MSAIPILCIINHPRQYDGPLWAALKARGRLDPIVWYVQTAKFVDPEIGQALVWNNDQTVPRLEEVSPDRFAEKLKALEARPAAVLSESWARGHTWRMAGLCLVRGIPMVLPSDRVVNPAEPSWRRAARRLIRKLTRPVFGGHMTPGIRGTAALLADGVSPDRIAQALYPVDVALFQRRLGQLGDKARGIRARWPRNANLVIAVAKHVERESPLLIIEAFAAAKRREPTARLLFVGDGPMRPVVEARIAELGLAGDVHLPGYVPYPELPAYYGAADAFIHVAENEPWGISVSEAMACGLPVICTTSVGSTDDLVVAGVTGFVSASTDAETLGLAIVDALALARDPATRDNVLKQVDRIDVHRASERIETLVATLIASRDGRAAR